MSGIFQKNHSRMPGQSPSQYLGFPTTSESPPQKGLTHLWKFLDPYLGVKDYLLRFLADSHGNPLPPPFIWILRVLLRAFLTGSILWKTSLSTFHQLEPFEIDLHLSADPQDLIRSSRSSGKIVHSPHPIILPRSPVKQPVSNRNTEKRHTALLPPRITVIVKVSSDNRRRIAPGIHPPRLKLPKCALPHPDRFKTKDLRFPHSRES